MDSAQHADDVLHEVLLPKGYFVSASGDYLPWFDNEGRQLGLLLHSDGTVTWQLRGRNGEVLEPEQSDGDDDA